MPAVSDSGRLPRSFYGRDAVRLARALLGTILRHESPEGATAGRIVETEAYCGPQDRAAHSYGGRRTPRNEVMWGPAGHAYVYFIYGMHWCVNVVAAAPGCPEAVLIRALEPVEGLELIRLRRGPGIRDEWLLRGPGNLCRGMGIDGRHNGADLVRGALTLLRARAVPAHRVKRTPRVGIAGAGEHARLLWRFRVEGSASVSGK